MRNKLNKTRSDKPAALPAQAQVALNNAIALHQQGNIDAAQTVYESILKSHPKNFDALHLLGVVAYQKKSFLIAQNLIIKAILINDSHAASHLHLGNAFQELEQRNSTQITQWPTSTLVMWIIYFHYLRKQKWVIHMHSKLTARMHLYSVSLVSG